jgi:hypothetical protein
VAETYHQLQVFGDRLRIVGKVRGQDFGVQVDLAEGSAAWDPDITYKPPTSSPEAPPSTDCPGCKKGIAKLIKGGWGWARAALTTNAPDAVVAERKRTCGMCPSACYDFGVCRDDWPNRTDEEQGCGCILALKVLVPSESCPHGHWEAV